MFFSKKKYVSSFEAGNCVNNSSFKWMRDIKKLSQQDKGYKTFSSAELGNCVDIVQIKRFNEKIPWHGKDLIWYICILHLKLIR